MKSKNQKKNKLAKLDFLIGKWHSEGKINGSTKKIKGSDSYEWALDRTFILHRVDVMIGKERTEAIELMGEYRASTGKFMMRSFDTTGSSVLMKTSVTANGVLKIAGPNIRSTLTVNKNGKQMHALWEQRKAGSSWQPWMEMTFKK